MSENELPDQEELEIQKIWVQDVDKVLLSWKKYTPERELMQKILKDDPHFEQIYEFYSYNLTLDMVQYFQAGVTQRNKEDCSDYFAIMRRLYMMFSERSKLSFHKEFIKEWQHYPIDYTPYFETIVRDYHYRVKQCLDAVNDDPDDVETHVKEELRWLMLISPVTTTLKLFIRSVQNPAIIPFIMDICHQIPALFYDRVFKIYHNEFETEKNEPLLAVIFRRFICCCRCETTEDLEWDSLELLAMALCNGEEPLLNCWILLDVVFGEIYTKNRVPTKSVEILTGLASRLLCAKNMRPFTPWKWAISMRQQPEENLFLTPTIIDMTLKLMAEYFQNDKSADIPENCKLILKYIGERMREENAEFDEETKEYLLNSLKDFPWYVEYAMSTWYWALNVTKRRVPSAIFEAISIEDVEKSEKFEEIESPDESDSNKSLPEAYMLAIMEIGLYDVECALELLHAKCSIPFQDMDLNKLITNALKETFTQKVGLHGVAADVKMFLMQILEVFDKNNTSQHEQIVESIRNALPIKLYTGEFPRWTHEIKKSLVVQALAKPHKTSPIWPPEDNQFVPIGMKEIRREQKLERERLLQAAIKKTNDIAQHHRDTWAKREEPIKGWSCPKSPPNEPVFMSSNTHAKRSYSPKFKRNVVVPTTSTMNVPSSSSNIPSTSAYLENPNPPKFSYHATALMEGVTQSTSYGGCSRRGGRR